MEEEKGPGGCVFLHSWDEYLCKNAHIGHFRSLIRCNMAVLGRHARVCFFAMKMMRVRNKCPKCSALVEKNRVILAY